MSLKNIDDVRKSNKNISNDSAAKIATEDKVQGILLIVEEW